MDNHPARWGAWLLTAAAVGGLVAALISYFTPSSGIDHTAGCMLVIVSTALLAVGGLILALADGPGWLRVLMLVLTALDLVGTALAAYFLEAWVLLALMAAAAVGWVVCLFRPSRRTEGAAA